MVCGMIIDNKGRDRGYEIFLAAFHGLVRDLGRLLLEGSGLGMGASEPERIADLIVRVHCWFA